MKPGRTFQSLVEVFTGDTDDELRKDDIIATTNLDVLLEIRVPLIRLIEN